MERWLRWPHKHEAPVWSLAPSAKIGAYNPSKGRLRQMNHWTLLPGHPTHLGSLKSPRGTTLKNDLWPLHVYTHIQTQMHPNTHTKSESSGNLTYIPNIITSTCNWNLKTCYFFISDPQNSIYILSLHLSLGSRHSSAWEPPVVWGHNPRQWRCKSSLWTVFPGPWVVATFCECSFTEWNALEWGDGLVGEVLSERAWRTEFNPQEPT